MNFFGSKLEGFATALVVLVAILLVSCGLCGLSLGLAATGGGNQMSGFRNQFIIITGVGSGAAIVLSMLGIGIVAVAWIIRAAFRRPSDNLEGLLDPNRDREGKDSQ